VLRFMIWDVEHGSAARISTPNGTNIVVDLGVGSYGLSDETFSPLLHLKHAKKVQQLDLAILTHPHRDHLDDIFNFDALSPRFLTRPRHLSEAEIRAGNRSADSAIIDKCLEIDSRFNALVSAPSDPRAASNNGGVGIESFFPTSCATSNLNNHSVITVFSYASSKLLIPGDNEPASWDELLKREDFRKAIKGTDVLVAPHHGRDSGFSSALFEHISPRLTIISDGRFCDTSATDRYGAHTRGWTVHHRGGAADEERKCVTTHSDGDIEVKFGFNGDAPFIHVNMD
jgi:beta-lactamase superfamily II metal-dependent hydrolase